MRVTVAKRLRTNDKSSTFRRNWIDHGRLGSGLNNNAGAEADAASCGARNSGVSYLRSGLGHLGRYRLRLRLASGLFDGLHENENSIFRWGHTIFGMASCLLCLLVTLQPARAGHSRSIQQKPRGSPTTAIS
jgi:hypothetical protein